MDITSAVRSDALPAVGSILAPGAVAAAPFVALAWGPPHDLKAFIDSNQGISTAAGALLVVLAGLLVESLGSYVENFWIDECHDDPITMRKEWREYLLIAWQTEPIGQGYLRKLLTVFKFELNLFVAVVLTLPGTVALGYFGVLGWKAFLAAALGSAALAGLLLKIAVDSSKLLARMRSQLVAQARNTGAWERPAG